MNADSVRAAHDAVVAAVELTARVYRHELYVSNVLAFGCGVLFTLIAVFVTRKEQP